MPPSMRRRELLAGTALCLVSSAVSAQARIVAGALPWQPSAGAPPVPVRPGPWQFFTPEEGAAVEALVDRLIPPDPETPGGKDAGCAVFIDRQLAGPLRQRAQASTCGRLSWRRAEAGRAVAADAGGSATAQALAALDEYCRATFAGKPFAPTVRRAEGSGCIAGMENGPLQLDGRQRARDSSSCCCRTRSEGFFADPIYGGNRDMVGWKMIGFPGARYDYRDWVERHNERYPLAAGQHRRAARMGRALMTAAAREDKQHDAQAAGDRCRHRRAGLDRLDPGRMS